MHYLVTGGAGFIGSHLSEALLACGHRVTILDDLSTGKREFVPPAASLIIGDVRTNIVRHIMEDIDGIFHLAAIASVERSHQDWLGSHSVNLTGTLNILSAARANAVPVVYASSASIYGDQETSPLHEALLPKPISAYGADKFACELQGRIAWQIYGVPNMALRFFNAYGPRQDPNSPYTGVISIFAKRALQRQTLLIHGDGRQARDYVYVSDVAAAMQAAMQALHEKIITHDSCNIGTGHATSVLDIADAICAATACKAAYEHTTARPGDPKLLLADIARARELLGFKAKIPLAEGIRETVNYIKLHEI